MKDIFKVGDKVKIISVTVTDARYPGGATELKERAIGHIGEIQYKGSWNGETKYTVTTDITGPGYNYRECDLRHVRKQIIVIKDNHA